MLTRSGVDVMGQHGDVPNGNVNHSRRHGFAPK
jgi:hypothetical protein